MPAKLVLEVDVEIHGETVHERYELERGEDEANLLLRMAVAIEMLRESDPDDKYTFRLYQVFE